MAGWHGWTFENSALWLAVDPSGTREADSVTLVYCDSAGTTQAIATFINPVCADLFQGWMDRALAATGELNAVLAAMIP